MAKNELTTANNTAVADADVDALLNEFAGAGTSASAEHNTIPLIYILQSNSPAVNKRGDAYIDGAEAGDLWLRNAEKPIVKGTEGLIFHPVHFQFAWTVWKPDRGGLVSVGSDRPAGTVQKQIDANDERLSWVTPEGNIAVETCYAYGLVNGELPYVLPLSSSGYTVARNWNTNARARKHNGKPLPLFATRYKLSTVYRQNDKGSWFTLGFEFVEGLPTKEQLVNGLEFFKAVSSGEKKAEAPHVDGGDSEIPF